MKRLLLIPSMILSLLCSRAMAQAPFTTMDDVNINNIDAMVSVHGDVWRNPVTGTANCVVPNGSGKNIASAGALWMSGYDNGNGLHIAAQTDRTTGNDYWPGPLDVSGTLTYVTSQNWAKIWKVTRKDIQIFQALTAAGTATKANTAAAIWEWPANGNRYAKGNGGVALSITTDMAPFVDINGNGIYEPDMGEYPDVPGDQNLWWVFSDNGPTHSQTNGTPLNVEVHALAFAFRRWDIMDNVMYFQYNVLNKSANNYLNFRIGQYANMDLGSPNDDYVGCDTNRGMGIVYNSAPSDAIYGSNMPMAGVIMRGIGTTGIFPGNFMYCNNDASATGMPTTSTEYDNYLRSKFKDGTSLTNDFTASGIKTTGRGTGPLTSYVFPGNPADHTQWSECNSGNTAGDRRFILSSGDLQFNAGAMLSVTMILVTSNVGSGNACGSADFSHIDTVADVAVAGYDDKYRNLPPIGLSVANTSASTVVNIYPNPANNTLFVENTGSKSGGGDISIYNVMGQAMPVAISMTGQRTAIDISRLPAGMYQVVYRGDATATARFVKE
jgi:hypothetical protein